MTIDSDTPPDAGIDPLDSLVDQATELEGAGQAQAEAKAQATAAASIETNAAELFSAFLMARAVAAPTMSWWDKFLDVWSDQALQGIANAGAQVMERHGWTLSETWDKFGPYIALGMAVVPPSLVTWQAVKHRQAQLAALQRRPTPMQNVVPASEGGAAQAASNAP